MGMNSIAVIGAGISGLSIAHCLKGHFNVRVFEKDSCPGGLIKCERVNGHLYHKVGGHVFNSKRNDVLNWFWNFFNQGQEFTLTQRNAVIYMSDGSLIDYPIEDNVYAMKKPLIKEIIKDIIEIAKNDNLNPVNFEEFLKSRFGNTLYDVYFRPYNEKIWRKDLREIPLSWLEGKLPMPTPEEILYNNIHRVKEAKMVHSSFYYPKNNGSQFLADRLSEKLNITYNVDVVSIKKVGDYWKVNDEDFDKVVFCGNIKDIPQIIQNIGMSSYNCFIDSLDYHGTTTVFCEMEKNPYCWIYLPDNEYSAHRIICTGNFAFSNNAESKTTATIEFTDYVPKEEIERQLIKIPFSPKYITHTYTQYTYPVQNLETRTILTKLRSDMEKENLYLLGRFAEWEYYNMDAAIGASIDLSKRIIM